LYSDDDLQGPNDLNYTRFQRAEIVVHAVLPPFGAPDSGLSIVKFWDAKRPNDEMIQLTG